MKQLTDEIRDLLDGQRLAVLATSLQGHPYTTLVAFVPCPDLSQLCFATLRTTRKFANLSSDSRISLLIDNRSNDAEDFRTALAVTALGNAKEIAESEREEWARLYLARHPSLHAFIAAPSCALFRVEVSRYCLVRRFQDVIEWEVER